MYNSSNNQPLYTIGITSNLLGVCHATLRLWEKKGLIRPHRISKNRFYSECNLATLREVKRLLQEERVNIAGVKTIISKSRCWELKKCSLKEREVCPVYKRNKVLECCAAV